MKDVIILNSGKEFPCKYLNIHSSGMLFINIDSGDLPEIIQYFTQETETKRIIYHGNVYANYTSFQSISKSYGNSYRVVLMRDNVGA